MTICVQFSTIGFFLQSLATCCVSRPSLCFTFVSGSVGSTLYYGCMEVTLNGDSELALDFQGVGQVSIAWLMVKVGSACFLGNTMKMAQGHKTIDGVVLGVKKKSDTKTPRGHITYLAPKQMCPTFWGWRNMTKLALKIKFLLLYNTMYHSPFFALYFVSNSLFIIKKTKES